jgi:hypothetical protein
MPFPLYCCLCLIVLFFNISFSRNKARQSGEIQEMQGEVVDIPMMEVENHIKIGGVIKIKRKNKIKQFSK